MSRWIGSLQLAVVGLSATIIFLAVGTLLESWYSAKIAQELIYSTWWFMGLMGVLALNIFFAAVKKWPWKRHQLGFLITHVGLLLLLAGGVLNALYGTDALMALVDTAELATLRELREELGPVSNRTQEIIFPQETLLTVSKTPDAEKVVSYPFRPGSLPWGDTAYDDRTPGWISMLDVIAHPRSSRFRREIAKDVFLDVTAFYPNCVQEAFRPAPRGQSGFPAMKLTLSSAAFGSLPAFWLAVEPKKFTNAYRRMGGGQIEFLGFCPESLTDEFLKPPDDDQRGTQGQVVVRLSEQTLRMDVAQQMGQKLPLGTSGWHVQLNRYLPALRIENSPQEPADPAVELTLLPPDGKPIPYLLPARWLVDAGPVTASGAPAPPTAGLPALLYHPPDWKFGASDTKGFVQLAATESGQVLFRSFSSKIGPVRLEGSGVMETGTDVPIWGGMEEMKFRVTLERFLLTAVEEPDWVPVATRPGLTRQDRGDPLHPVIRAELSIQKTDRAGKRQVFREEFKLRQDSRQRVNVQGNVDGQPVSETFYIGFSSRTEELPFSLRLVRAEQQVDPGSDRAATFTSFVQLTDPEEKITNQNHVITMNEPLDHRGFKFYQSEYRPLTMDSNGRPVNLSGFTVGRDPGLGLKYLGSIMLALGIACMFYMRAYSMETMRKAFADRLGLDQPAAPTAGEDSR